MKKVIFGIIGLIALGVGYWLVSPLFINEIVDEELPEGVELPPNPSVVSDPTGEPTLEPGDTRPADGVVPEQQLTGTNLEEQVAPEDMEEFMEMMKSVEDVIMEEEMPLEVMASSRTPKAGRFVDVAHEGSGVAKLLALPGGGTLVRLEDLDVDNGPDLRVLLSKEQNIRSSADLGEYIELGKLKGNKGNQNYEVPEDIDFSEYHSVIIYCKPFSVVFNSADLE